ncbi:hypothetical protein GGR50DRAFT_701697 [Xylaria sp. CBS 124048]|nr:hypothetical protein GGR50DRAFT_701697 [Xylaria sp. CBS 124048]
MDGRRPSSSEEKFPPLDSPAEGARSPLPPSPSPVAKKEKGRVRFNSTADVEPVASALRLNKPQESNDAAPAFLKPMPRPALLRTNSYASMNSIQDEDVASGPNTEGAMSARAAQERARHVAATVLKSHSAPSSRRTSLDVDVDDDAEAEMYSLQNYPSRSLITPLPPPAIELSGLHLDGRNDATQWPERNLKTEAYNIVRSHTQRHLNPRSHPSTPIMTGTLSGQVTPTEERAAEIYVPPPQQFRGSVLYNLLKLHRQSDESQPPSYPHSARSDSGFATPGSSGTLTPTRKKWYDKSRPADPTLANLVEASARLANVSDETAGDAQKPPSSRRSARPRAKRNSSGRLLRLGRPQIEDEIRITINISEILSRQKYIIKMCKALMLYGAPTHRLEEYLTMTARVLEIDGQFLYLPGCMIISFDDKRTHTTEVKIVRVNQGIDLGKLKDIHEVYKSVLHDLYGVDAAIEKISAIMDAKDKFHPWLRVLAFGLASAFVAPFAFGGRWIDLPMCFILGAMVGALQIIVAPKSALYNNLFEISATILTSFLARLFGSIGDGELFCFSALAQSSIALILPGWFVLSAALELQSRALVPGSIRLVYAIIYSLFLGFGITVGTVLYGLFNPHATSATSCSGTMDPHLAFIFVPLFTLCLAVVNQAKWKQIPVMVCISFVGYVVDFFSSPHFKAAPQIANTLGAFTVGVCANLYSRLRHGVAAAALLPAIFVQVPSGLAATGSLLSGLTAANQINHNDQPINGTSLPINVGTETGNFTNVVFNVAGSMIQIAIGITLGLFLSALVVYPFGKRRSGLWTL